MSDKMRKDGLIDILPGEMTHYGLVMMKNEAYNTYNTLKVFLKDHISMIVDLGSRSTKPLFNVADEQRDADRGSERSSGRSSDDDGMSVPDEVLSMMQDRADEGDPECMAFMNKFKGKGGKFTRGGAAGRRAGGPAGGRAAPPPRDKRDVTCANCGITGHIGQDFRKAKVEFSMRLCHICKKLGHHARNFTDAPKPKGNVNFVTGAVPVRNG